MTNTMKRLAVLLIGTLFVLCVAIVLAVSLPVSTAFAAEGETATDTGSEATVHDHNDETWTELTSDGGTLQSGNYYLTSDVTLTTDITVADNATVTLCLNGYKLTGAGTSAVITVGAGADFTLEDCSADASAPAGRGVITGGIGFLDEYSARHGGGVYISGNSTFTMNGGTISGNTATFGGGVGVDNDGTFTMNGGTISGNTANFDGGGVELVNGTFTMTGGTISGNSAYDWGGGVYVRNNSTFTMEGGTITDNTAKTFGGGVYVAYGTFTMSGGTISNNSAVYNDDGGNGGGVGVDNYGTFTMNGGTISGNTATVGGGVGVDNYGTFTMNGGTISDNTANYGGGVYARYGTFTLKGGTISDNVATRNGGGVYVAYGTSTMNSGTISGNTAANGGGVNVDGTFNMNGGTIADNTATNDGGGVYVHSSTFTMSGGTISDNMATYFGSCVYKNGGTVSISGGYLDGTIDGSTVSISGGYFSEAPDAAHLAEGRGAYDISALGGVLFDFDYIEGYPYAVYVKGVISISTKDIVYDGSPVAEGVDFTVEGADGVTLTYSYKAEGGDEFTAGLPTNAGEYAVSVYALNGEKQFLSVEFNITIAKATPVYTTPTDLTICADHTLADIALPSGWTWKDSSVAVGEAGEKTFAAVFTPEDTLNYNTVEGSVTVTVTAHTGDTATCTDKAVCSVCGMEYGELAPHVFDQKVATAEYLASEATCTQKATYYYSCVCGEKDTETFEYGELAAHTAAEIPAVEATCTQSGMTAGSKCSVCGEILVAPEEIAPLGHVDENDDELCDRCGFDMSIPEFTITVTGGTIEGAIGSTVIVEENGSVTVVASEAPEGKEFKGWSIDGGETIISAEAAYTFTASEDTVLTAVFADKQSDVKPGGEITPENPEGLSGGAIAGIVIGSVFGALIIAYGVCALLYKKKILKGAFFEKIYPFIKD